MGAHPRGSSDLIIIPVPVLITVCLTLNDLTGFVGSLNTIQFHFYKQPETFTPVVYSFTSTFHRNNYFVLIIHAASPLRKIEEKHADPYDFENLERENDIGEELSGKTTPSLGRPIQDNQEVFVIYLEPLLVNILSWKHFPFLCSL